MIKQINIKKCRGTTIIEILVTVIVFSIGLLGIIGMQSIGLQNNTTAYNRSQATILAYDLADRVRANVNALGNYNYSSSLPTSTVSACESTTGCSSTELAQYDVYNWLQDLAAGLPAGTGTICIDSDPANGNPSNFSCDGNGSVYAIKVWWDEERSGVQNNYKMFYTSLRFKDP